MVATTKHASPGSQPPATPAPPHAPCQRPIPPVPPAFCTPPARASPLLLERGAPRREAAVWEQVRKRLRQGGVCVCGGVWRGEIGCAVQRSTTALVRPLGGVRPQPPSAKVQGTFLPYWHALYCHYCTSPYCHSLDCHSPCTDERCTAILLMCTVKSTVNALPLHPFLYRPVPARQRAQGSTPYRGRRPAATAAVPHSRPGPRATPRPPQPPGGSSRASAAVT